MRGLEGESRARSARSTTAIRRSAAFLAWLTGCGMGLLDGEGGGADNLPTLGAGPYAKPLVGAVLTDGAGSLLDPTALPRAGGGYRLWCGWQPDNSDASEIWYAELSALGEPAAVEPNLVLRATEVWEEGRVARPSVIEVSDSLLVLMYEGGLNERSIGRADSSDGGKTWQKHPDNPLLVDGQGPSLVRADEEWQLFFTRAQSAGIYRATSADGLAYQAAELPVLSPRPGLADAFDGAVLADPAVTRHVTTSGRPQYSMFVNGTDQQGDVSIGFAGSFDGVTWDRFLGPDPVLEAGPPSEHGPSALVSDVLGVMFFHQRDGQRRGIAVALHP